MKSTWLILIVISLMACQAGSQATAPSTILPTVPPTVAKTSTPSNGDSHIGVSPTTDGATDEATPSPASPSSFSQATPSPEVPTLSSTSAPEPLTFPTPAAPTTAVRSGTNGTDAIGADVINVSVSGSSGAYRFSVTVQSPDTGCEQYADWWEVLSIEGDLLYRRVLLHSHVGEQPFTRSGGPVPLAANETVIVRAHMNTSGYSGTGFLGSPEQGFAAVTLETDFAPEAQTQPPLPSGCDF